jgi:hypothetical protein
MEGFQLSLPLMPATIAELYVDQAMSSVDIYDRNIFCAYTPHGIREMDHEYCQRIMNCAKDPEALKTQILDRKDLLKKMWLERKQKNTEIIKTKAGTIIYTDSQIDREIKRLEERIGEELSRVGEDPEKLKDEILCNPHLHACIKENLLDNLDRILREKQNEKICLNE